MEDYRHILDLISQGENLQLDFKYEVSDSRKIARTLSAFSNTEGGILLIGVKDNGSISGISGEEEFYMIQAAAEMYSRPSVHFKAKEWAVEGKNILEVVIPKDPSKIHKAPYKGNLYKAYVRVADENFLVPPAVYLSWKKRMRRRGVNIKMNRSAEELLSLLSENRAITIGDFCRNSHIDYYSAREMLSDLLAVNAIRYRIQNNRVEYILGK